MGYVNRKCYDNSKLFEFIVTSIPKPQMGITWSICDYRIIVSSILKSQMVIIISICDYSVRVNLNRKYTNITNVPKPQMYNILLLILSSCTFTN